MLLPLIFRALLDRAKSELADLKNAYNDLSNAHAESKSALGKELDTLVEKVNLLESKHQADEITAAQKDETWVFAMKYGTDWRRRKIFAPFKPYSVSIASLKAISTDLEARLLSAGEDNSWFQARLTGIETQYGFKNFMRYVSVVRTCPHTCLGRKTPVCYIFDWQQINGARATRRRKCAIANLVSTFENLHAIKGLNCCSFVIICLLVRSVSVIEAEKLEAQQHHDNQARLQASKSQQKLDALNDQ